MEEEKVIDPKYPVFDQMFDEMLEEYPYMNDAITKRIFFIEQKGLCEYCKCDLYKEILERRNLAIDHKNPKRNGGNDNMDNLCLTCQWCNSSKKYKSTKEFMEYLKPYFDKKICKEDLSQYHKYKELHKKFSKIK